MLLLQLSMQFRKYISLNGVYAKILFRSTQNYGKYCRSISAVGPLEKSYSTVSDLREQWKYPTRLLQHMCTGF